MVIGASGIDPRGELEAFKEPVLWSPIQGAVIQSGKAFGFPEKHLKDLTLDIQSSAK